MLSYTHQLIGYYVEMSHPATVPGKKRDINLEMIELTEGVSWREGGMMEESEERKGGLTETGVAGCRRGQTGCCGEVVLRADVHVIVM